MDYHFETVQNLKLGVYDIDNSSADLGDDDYLGGVELTLGQVHTRLQRGAPLWENVCVSSTGCADAFFGFYYIPLYIFYWLATLNGH